MASYVLLSQHELKLVSEGLSLMKWLSQQRNHGGGFGSTQVSSLLEVTLSFPLNEPVNIIMCKRVIKFAVAFGSSISNYCRS